MAAQKTEGESPVIIKKYANRRLYNTDKSTYVTLENLAEMVREGQDFVVTDAKTGDDITRSVLTQIIFEEESKGRNMLPTNFLRQLIRLYGDTLQGFVPGYLDASMQTFTNNQERMREQVRTAFDANPAIANFEAMARSNMEWFENTVRMFSPFVGKGGLDGGVSGEASGSSGGTEQGSGASGEKAASPGKDVELDALKKQLEAMQQQLSDLVKKG